LFVFPLRLSPAPLAILFATALPLTEPVKLTPTMAAATDAATAGASVSSMTKSEKKRFQKAERAERLKAKKALKAAAKALKASKKATKRAAKAALTSTTTSPFSDLSPSVLSPRRSLDSRFSNGDDDEYGDGNMDLQTQDATDRPRLHALNVISGKQKRTTLRNGS
jgi:hypothetical protein